VIGLPMTTAEYNETNPFALRIDRAGKKASYVLVHQPTSFDWRARDAKPHPLRRAPEDVFTRACRALNQIVEIGAD
jgi:mRNA interferase MazF